MKNRQMHPRGSASCASSGILGKRAKSALTEICIFLTFVFFYYLLNFLARNKWLGHNTLSEEVTSVMERQIGKDYIKVGLELWLFSSKLRLIPIFLFFFYNYRYN